MSKQFIEVDLSDFATTAKKLVGRDWPKAVANAFSKLAAAGDAGVTAETKQKFELHSDYITRGIKHYPHTDVQKEKAISALEKYGDMNAAVFLRGAYDSKKSLEFMADHEQGKRRLPQDQHIAIPTKTLKQKAFRTNKGRVRKRYKPNQLLQRFNESGSVFKNGTTVTTNRSTKKRLPGHAFLIKGRSGVTFIARTVARNRKGKRGSLEFLYAFYPQAQIKERWGFEETVWREVTRRYARVIANEVEKLPEYNKGR